MATFAELAEILDGVADRAEAAMPSVAMAMALAFQHHVSTVTLHRYSHGRYSKTPAPPGMPPAWVSGHLASSFEATPGPSGGGTGRAFSGPTADYARIQELGGDIEARNRRFLRWLTDYPTPNTNFAKSEREGGGLYLNFARRVHLPARPYMERGVDEVIASGALERAKIAVFMAAVWGE